MKNFVRLILILFVMTLSLWAEPSGLYAQPVDLTGSIQNIKTETVVLVSNNILGGEIVSSDEKNTNNYIGSSTLVAEANQEKNLFNHNIIHFCGSFIHNLSTDNQKIHLIRAP